MKYSVFKIHQITRQYDHSLYNCRVPYAIVSISGKTVWTSVRSTWSGRRNLIEADNKYSASINVSDARASLQSYESLLSTLPSWCLFQGMIVVAIILSAMMD